jgi:DedD protein
MLQAPEAIYRLRREGTMAATQDTEITLGTGRLLGLFFGLVVVCALFFGFGYTLGRGTSKQSGSIVSQDGTSVTTTSTVKPVGTGQPAASSSKASDCTTSGTDCSNAAAASSQTAQTKDMTFYKSVEQKDAPTQLENAEPAPEMKTPPAPSTTIGAGYMVQVAAVSKPEDADLLRNALQGKQYPVVVTSAPGDKLFHVQVGPFADMKDAEAIKSRLTSDGYTPILKK